MKSRNPCTTTAQHQPTPISAPSAPNAFDFVFRISPRPRVSAVIILFSLTASAQQLPPPRLDQNQLIVDGRPFLVLGGELHNTVSSDRDRMKTVWPELAKAHLNTVLVGVGWNWIEPREGNFDFRIVDSAIESARENNLRVILL